MSFLTKAKGGGKDGGFGSTEYEDPEALANWHERQGRPMQAVRVRLWTGLPQRISHRPLVVKWCNSKLAQSYEPPQVPRWLDGPIERDNSEGAQMDRAMWLLEKGRVNQQQVNAWPDRWRKIGATLGYLNTDGLIRFGGKA